MDSCWCVGDVFMFTGMKQQDLLVSTTVVSCIDVANSRQALHADVLDLAQRDILTDCP